MRLILDFKIECTEKLNFHQQITHFYKQIDIAKKLLNFFPFFAH